jgi:hypothetical protein
LTIQNSVLNAEIIAQNVEIVAYFLSYTKFRKSFYKICISCISCIWKTPNRNQGACSQDLQILNKSVCIMLTIQKIQIYTRIVGSLANFSHEGISYKICIICILVFFLYWKCKKR